MPTWIATLRVNPARFAATRKTHQALAPFHGRPQSHAFAAVQSLHPQCRAHVSALETTCLGSGKHHLHTALQNFRMQRAHYHYEATAKTHRAFIALGSNIGNRVAMIEQACKEMESTGKIHITRTSSLWESKAMYVLDQDSFVNGACEIATPLSPIQLLNELQKIEQKMGRVKLIDKGPRNVDLDILLYDNVTYLDERLEIPHKHMLEREFVLRPLCELITEEKQQDFPFKLSLQSYLKTLPPPGEPLVRLTPLAPDLSPISSAQISLNTRIMAILNTTPDSFSDGGQFYNRGNALLEKTMRERIEAGATIIDIGGQSTRPGAIQVSVEEELARVLPAVKLMRSIPEATDITVSIDTYFGVVAEEAIKAGAHLINDVSAGTMDDTMLPTMAKLGCTVCLMHMRGTPGTMNNTEMMSYPDGIVETVGRELLGRVRAAEMAGVRRWRIILDPGIGFAKTHNHNLELLRRQDELMRYPGLEGMPWLVGTSRKAFIGQITGVKDAYKRTWGTAVAISAAIQGGVDIVRVHDVDQMAQVVKMADALWPKRRFVSLPVEIQDIILNYSSADTVLAAKLGCMLGLESPFLWNDGPLKVTLEERYVIRPSGSSAESQVWFGEHTSGIFYLARAG
ncbi:Dihydropteroate synthase [Pyrenophora seminiperda CCB06]|uniref:Folic acid synthesis protein FOL1 n=1 Tax=Pyrenophora seminiperda CCB06 TaxID=1302712 RepID=A0A3M7MFM5_9PLEO|nr:Dihydropteroate synthase [Pyrenophora seminiperda CCB06]